jgi:squalene-hopene/tetraprenyl-beta-curcumene cyclase
VISAQERNTLVADLRSRQRPDGGWSLWSMGKWTWSRSSAPFVSPGTLDTARLEKSDGLATGLVVYALRETGSPADDPLVKRGLEWLRTNVQSVQIDGRPHTAWRAHSLNYDRERGGPRGVPWRQMFMSNAATAFAVLALVGPECASASAQRC